MNKDFPFISVVIPVRNGERYLDKCLEALANIDYPASNYEIIVADGMSEDNSITIAKKHKVKLIENKKRYSIPGRNQAVGIAKGFLVAFLNDDTIVKRDWLKNSIKYFKNKKVGGIEGALLIPQDQNLFGRATGIIFRSVTFIRNIIKTDSLEHAPLSNAIYLRSALERIFPFDEKLMFEDVEMARLVQKAGYKIVSAPDVSVLHYSREDPVKLWLQVHRYGIARMQTFKRRPSLLGFIEITGGILLLYLFISVAPLVFILGLILTKSASFSFYLIQSAVIIICAWNAGMLKEIISPYIPK